MGSAQTLDVFCAQELDLTRVSAALCRTRRELLAARSQNGVWTGELSSSALSTATAVIALAIAERESSFRAAEAAFRGLDWLAQHVNGDRGWGDTTQSFSNISTTALCWAAFGAASGLEKSYTALLDGAEDYLRRETERANGRTPESVGNSRGAMTRLDPAALAKAIISRYGKDRTFSAPILTACALAGRLGPGDAISNRESAGAWYDVIPLPFELAALPHQLFAALRLPVVSYALPALIAIGQARHFHLPSRNPLVRLVRACARGRTLKVLEQIQPVSGGFLEATPLTSFVVMSLASIGQADHPVTRRGLEFLLASQRRDGSWPIDTNLGTWVTTLAVNAISGCPEMEREPAEGDWRSPIRQGLLRQQYQTEHPYTHASPGGWAWTDLPGGVPDADDTAGAVLALSNLGRHDAPDPAVTSAALSGIRWLLNLQNRDGGIPTFCRGWGALPFDRSSPDLTAHCIRAWVGWMDQAPPTLRRSLQTSICRALRFLRNTQREDGSWLPLWFGNQFMPDDQNPTYGTARVVAALCSARRDFREADQLLARGAAWLMQAQNTSGASREEGGWGGGPGAPESVEETALALEALATVLGLRELPAGLSRSELKGAVTPGTNWLLARIESGEWTRPSPMGFYFAKLWYCEKLYPQIFTVGALGSVERALAQ